MRASIIFTSVVLCACTSVPASQAAPATVAVVPAAEPTAEQMVVAREAGMHMAATLLYQGVKKAALAQPSLSDQMHYSDGLARWAEAIPGLFPPGSDLPDDRARPEIWANKADFRAKAAALESAATRLSELAKANDKAGYVAQTAAIDSACKSCHTAYRSN